MGDGGSDVGYVSFLVCRLMQRNFGLVFWFYFGICFDDFSKCTYVYGCKYRHELSYKYLVSGMGVMLL